MTVSQRYVVMAMTVGFRTFPAFVFMLVMRVMTMQVAVIQRLMCMLKRFRLFYGPENPGDCGREQSYCAHHAEGRRQVEVCTDPTGEWIGNQPAGMGRVQPIPWRSQGRGHNQ